jgi:hypothetical protein
MSPCVITQAEHLSLCVITQTDHLSLCVTTRTEHLSLRVRNQADYIHPSIHLHGVELFFFLRSLKLYSYLRHFYLLWNLKFHNRCTRARHFSLP